MIEIKIEQDTITAALNAIQSRLSDMTPIMREIARYMHGAVIDNFEAEGRPKWKPSRRAIEQNGKTLQKNRILRNSIITESTSNQAIVGTNVVYAAIHQFGGTITQKPRRYTLAFNEKGRFLSRKNANKRKRDPVKVAFANYKERKITMPARPFLSLTDSDFDTIKEKLAEYLTK